MAANFDFKRRLGSGNFGEVWLAIETGLNAVRAVKLIPRGKLPDPNNFFREAQILKSAEHPNIVHVEDTGTMADGRIYVAMEYLERGSLEDEYSGGFIGLSRAKRLMIDALRGLEHAHGKGIIHHDVKPANILIGNAGEAKLSDFGLALTPSRDPRNLRAQDYNYTLHVAPEVFAGGPHSVQSDIYASGITLYRIINGDSYLPQIPIEDVPAAAAAGTYPDRSKHRDFIPRQLRAITTKAMSVDPNDRFGSAREFRKALEKLRLAVDWTESVLADRTVWNGSNGNKSFEVELYRQRTGGCEITVRQCAKSATSRRVGNLCSVHKTAVAGENAVRRVLQDLVLGRIC